MINWWTDEDRAAFDALTAVLIDQYDAPLPRGRATATRSTDRSPSARTSATSAGSASPTRRCGSRSTACRPDGEPEPIDGLTADQRFFYSWAQAWQAKVRPAETVRRLTIDPHSPPEFRCNQVVRNIDAFYEAFDVKPDDMLWLDPEKRVTIW